MKHRVAVALMAALLSLAPLAHGQQRAKPKPVDERKVVALLKANPIVTAAVRQAQRFGGAKDCRYEVMRASAEQFPRAGDWSYEAEITCQQGESSGIVRVLGRWPVVDGGFDEVQVAIFFAG